MEVVKENKNYKVLKKRSGRLAVKGADGQWINGNDKLKILIDEGLVKQSMPKPKAAPEEATPAAEAEATEEAPTEASEEA